MEVTPEIYAWFTSLNIINPFISYDEDPMNNFILPEKTVNLLFGGKYLDIIIKYLQDAYNKCYKVKMDFIYKLKELKQISEDEDYISNNIKSTNWSIIFETLKKFGINYTEEDLDKIINNDQDFLLKVLTKIYEVNSDYLKKANEKKTKGKKMILGTSKNTADFDKTSKSSNILNETRTSQGVNEINNSPIMKKIIKDNTLNINTLDEKKSYEDCKSALEFFIISLSKNFNMKPRQCVALLSNNRKYLSIICNKGINGEFKNIKNWIDDLYNNFDVMMNLIKTSDDGLNISYGTIGTAICSKDRDIPYYALKLIHKIYDNIGMINWDWIKKEGYDSIIFTICKHEKNIPEIMKILYELSSQDINQFFNWIQNKVSSNEKNKILEFFSCVLPHTKKLNEEFVNDLQKIVYDICLNDQEDMSLISSILSDSFYYFYPIDENKINKTINYFKMCIKSNSLNIFGTATAHVFILMDRFGQMKNKYAPPLYKNIVLLFLELYDDIYRREFMLENFESFFNAHQEIPIDIFLEPYLSQINSVQNYNSSDLIFLFKMVEHPRIESHDISEIIQFVLGVCLNNLIYSRTANLILSLIFEKKLIQKICTPQDIKEINLKFVDFINNSLELFMSSINNLEDKAILETPYDIINEEFQNVNEEVHNQIINCVKQYRKIKKINCTGLLAMLWNYNDHDDVMMQMEEENREIYEPVDIVLQKMQKEQEIKDKKDFRRRSQMFLNEIQVRRNSVMENKEITDIQKKIKEDKIKKSLAEHRRIVSVMSGIESTTKKPKITENMLISTTSSKGTKFSKKNNLSQNIGEISGGKSNMFQAINNAQQKINEKKLLYENSNVRTEANQEEYYFKNGLFDGSDGDKNRFQEKRRDDIFEKYGKIMTIEEKKKMKEEQIRYKELEKIESSNILIQPEGKFVTILPGGGQIHKETGIKIKKYKSFHINNIISMLPLDLEEEEARELKAINGYNYEYKKNIKYYFKSYANEVSQLITKSKLLRMFRDRGFNKVKLDLEEVNDIIRNLFGDNISEFDFNQFCNLLVQISFLLYTKRRPTLTIGETYGILLRRFKIGSESETLAKTKRYLEPVIDLLLDKKENNETFNLPEGFKFIQKTTVKYNSRLAPHFMDILGESKFICYQVLEDIIFQIFNSSILEPYVEVSLDKDIRIEPEKIKKWSPGMYKAYIELDPKYKKIGIDCADALEDGIKKMLKIQKKGLLNLQSPYEKKIMEEAKSNLKKENKIMMELIQRRKEIKEQIEKYRAKKKQELNNRKQLNKRLRKKKREKILEVRKKFELIEERRKKQKEEENKKLEEMKEEKISKETRKNQKMIEFLTKEKSKMRKMNKELLNKKILLMKLQEEEKIRSGEIAPRAPMPDYFQKNKEYIEFEKGLNNTINNLLEKEDIKQVLDKYQNHLQLIYNIYSKIDFTKISFNFKEGIREESFKQFLINFTVLGLLVSSDQMTWIFKEITRPKLKERENQAYLDFHDFQMALAYLGIFARFADRNRKIKPADIDNTNGNTVEYFLKFMGLELPFDKLDLEQYINDRRAMTVKDLLNLQQELRKNDVMEFKKKEMEIEEKKKKEMRKKRMEMEKKKREEEKKSDNGNLNNNQQNEEKKSDNKSNKDIKSSKSIKSVKDNKNTKEDNKSANEKKEAKKKK